MLRLSNSQIGVFRDCPRAYLHRYIVGRVPRAHDDKLRFGRLWDEISGIVWEHDHRTAAQYLIDNADNIDEETAARLAALLIHYNPPKDKYEFIGNQVQEEFCPAGLHGVRVLAIADSILRDKATGELVIRECKTTSLDITGFGPYWQRLQCDSQLATYWIAFHAQGILYDVVKRPQIRLCGKDVKAAGDGADEGQVADAYQLRLAENIVTDRDKYYQLRNITLLPETILEAESDIVQTAKMIRVARKFHAFPKNSNHCTNKYGTCPYLGVCTGVADIYDDEDFADYTRR